MRETFLPFSPPLIGEEEINEVVATLRSDWITTGPRVARFEQEFATFVGAPGALALSSCTAALHLALVTLGIGPGDHVVTTPLTFCSTVHAIEHTGARPVFVDVLPETLNIDPTQVAEAVKARRLRRKAPEHAKGNRQEYAGRQVSDPDAVVRAILPVHLYGHPSELDSLIEIARQQNLALVEDAAHALPAKHKGRTIGSPVLSLPIANLICFSFYATKNLTTAEGGMLTGPRDLLAEARIWSQQGIREGAQERYGVKSSWSYEVVCPGFKYNMTDLQAAIGQQQLAKLPSFHKRRREIATRYTQAFSEVDELQTPAEQPEVEHAWHLYVLRLNLERLKISRSRFIEELKAKKIGTSVHFIPVHLHPYYRDKYGYKPGDFPVAYREYQRLLSLPLHCRMSDEDVQDVIKEVTDIVGRYRRRLLARSTDLTPQPAVPHGRSPQAVASHVREDSMGCSLPTQHIEETGSTDRLSHLHLVPKICGAPNVTQRPETSSKRRAEQYTDPPHAWPSARDCLQLQVRNQALDELILEQLIGRKPMQLNLARVREEVQGKRVLVTGAGGSIGSELCRQLTRLEPDLLILFEREETSLYTTRVGLNRFFPAQKLVPVLADISDRPKVEETIGSYTPDIVYHAAAYKHVPLLEEFPLEAMENNIFGTETLARAACQGRVKKFIFISTDKAVRPTTILGMTKRVAENLLLCLNGGTTKFISVRFGNVLTSAGSVFHLFRWQINTGGPVTVTDPGATRYFILLPEAAQLVLLAGAMGRGGEIVYHDSGRPVRILDLAENLIQRSGLEPGSDVPIQITGLRPGEKLCEQFVAEGDAILTTGHEKLFMVRNSLRKPTDFRKEFERLRSMVRTRHRPGAVAQLQALAARY